ncbi:hypothetical protein [Methylocystis heyeri]|nr:hypothetical protein [Methylocystis heyeri]
MNAGPGPFQDAQVSLSDKRRFLSDRGSYPHAPREVSVVETHMALVFLAGDKVFKLKKPVRFPFLDFSTLEAREAMCREELRLNRRLNDGLYIGVLSLKLSPAGGLTFGEGEVVDWLVEMRRLPAERMLDRLIDRREAGNEEIGLLCRKLAGFYGRAARSAISPAEYYDRFLREQRENRRIIESRPFAIDRARANAVLDRLDDRLCRNRALLEQRAASGRVVDGHGDLRPEHICFAADLAIFDCLEFNAALRQVDPFDELAFLGMECALLGDGSFGRKVIAGVGAALEDSVRPELVSLYAAWRAALRARLALAHLLDSHPRLPEKWEPLAARYLALAESALREV